MRERGPIRAKVDRPGPGIGLVDLVAGGAVVLAGALIATEVTKTTNDTSAALLLGGFVALGAVALIALIAPLWLFVAAFVMLAAVFVEPAPVDVLFIALMGLSFGSRRVSPRLPGAISAVLGLLIAVGLISTMNAAEFARAVRFELITLYLIALAVWLTWMFRDARATRLALHGYVIGATATAGIAAVARFVPFPSSELFLYDEFRAQGLFEDPNVFAAFLVPAAAIALEEVARPRLLPWSRTVSGIVFAILCTGTIVAFSRAGWLNLALACTTILLATAFRRGGLRLAVRSAGAVVVTLIVGLVLLAATGSLAFLQERSQLAAQSYDEERFSAQSSAVAAMTDHTFGHGPGQVEVGFEVATHSLYVRSAYEQGVGGVVLATALLVATLAFAWGLLVRDASVHGVGSAALFGSWLGVVASSFFIDTLHWRHLWMLAALIWVGAVGATGSSRGDRGQRRGATEPQNPPSRPGIRRPIQTGRAVPARGTYLTR